MIRAAGELLVFRMTMGKVNDRETRGGDDPDPGHQYYLEMEVHQCSMYDLSVMARYDDELIWGRQHKARVGHHIT
jgi:hypothetical protein